MASPRLPARAEMADDDSDDDDDDEEEEEEENDHSNGDVACAATTSATTTDELTLKSPSSMPSPLTMTSFSALNPWAVTDGPEITPRRKIRRIN